MRSMPELTSGRVSKWLGVSTLLAYMVKIRIGICGRNFYCMVFKPMPVSVKMSIYDFFNTCSPYIPGDLHLVTWIVYQ